jgi:mannose/cellobiose epimerase-like protein (N-acyl-D-glucosamine 2-epimerase family)
VKHFVQSMTLIGYVTDVSPQDRMFKLRCRNGDVFDIHTGAETFYQMLRNLDELDRDRVHPPDDAQFSDPAAQNMAKYVQSDRLLAVQGIYQIENDQTRFDARIVHLVHSIAGRYLFEDTHWWRTQISRLADEWLDDLFDDRRNYATEDFAALYRTNLNIYGERFHDDALQECATLSRFIYGLSSAYLLTGNERYLSAARAGVQYQRETFRSTSHDGKYCFWHFGKRKSSRGARLVVASENGDDRNTIPLYEQIYALAGLAQYYRVTQEWEVLEDMRRTVASFQDFYHDAEEFGYSGHGGYFSHLDYATMRPDVEPLGDNKLRKNWNSVGDHIPAYLVNLLIALDTNQIGRRDAQDIETFALTCEEILMETSRLIIEKFPDENPDVPFVNERFHADWTPDHDWKWQKNRAIVGHNFKIAWNLTRVAHYFESRAAKLPPSPYAAQWREHAEKCMTMAIRLGDDMERVGIDPLCSGCFDAVERNPGNAMPIEFTWGATKDFWQQEQAILAYLILHGAVPNGNENQERKLKYLGLARELMTFWNLFFLDHDNRGYFFRVSNDGHPVIEGDHANKSGHSTCAYHVFEMNYLADIYIRCYLQQGLDVQQSIQREDGRTDKKNVAVDRNFCLFFKPDCDSGQTSINVLPDFMPHGKLQIAGIKINGVSRQNFSCEKFDIPLDEEERGTQIVIEYHPVF